MAEATSMRLAKAASTFNVSMSHVIEKLEEGGFTVEDKPTFKLTAEMVSALEKAFGTDKAIKEQADNTKIDKTKKETVEMPEDTIATAPKKKEEEKDVLIKTNLAHKEEETTIAAERVQLEGPKVVGSVDLDKGKKEKKKKEEEPPVAAPEVVEEKAKKKKPEPEPEPEQKIETKYQTLEGPKEVGRIDLTKFEEKPKKKEEPKADNKEGGEAKKNRTRKLVKKKERAPLDSDQYYDKKVENFQRKRDTVKHSEGAPVPAEISEKEIEDKIRATMAKIQAQTSKSDRSKLRRGKREAQQEKLAAEQEGLKDNKLQVAEFTSVAELASLMNIPPVQVIQTCMQLGVIVSINQRLDATIIELVAAENGFEVEFISAADQTAFKEEEPDTPEELQPRAPIVTIMGHVDHGKTSLLDYIRKTNVAAKEAGGITQHIGAYEVTTTSGRKITFLDTPGHEAFTAMRARGAKVTDVAVIVIAADDAVMPQTREAINHAQSAGVPMIFAFNKIDKDGANANKIREQLASMNLLVEEWGGPYQSQEISAKKGLNIDLLLDKILIQADLLELKANPEKPAVGSVIEATLDKGRGYTATLLVQAGTMKMSDIIVAGPYYGRIKAMFDHKGTKIKEAGPSTPVQVLGLNGAPQAGEKFKVFENEQDAKELANKRAQIERETGIRTKKHITLDEIGRRLALGNFKELNLIIKGDVDGSVEALADSLLKLGTEEIQIRIIHKGVGAISESDVLLATASDAIVIGFNVRPSANAKKIAETEGVDIRLYSIIYNAIGEIKSAMEGLLEPKIEEKIIGNLDVKNVIHVSKVGAIAGCFVRDGRILNKSKVRVIRDGIVIHTGNIAGLKRFKDDAKEVVSGLECGVQIKDYQDIQVGDVLEVFEEIEVQRKL
ncbi:MAG TPA: translation initiation factor IF-2 [Chitinophagales bacterium]|nr:translation initiation factor IF-2 [Chitinophagales bacterium]